MPGDDFDRTMARLMAMGTVGTEMAVPIVIGLGVDYWIGSIPWCTVLGAIIGLVMGIYHLVLLNRPPRK